MSRDHALATLCRLLLHPRLIFAELLLLFFLLVLSAVVPQATDGSLTVLASFQQVHPRVFWLFDQLDLVRIRTAPLFLATLAAIAASLTAVIARQTQRLFITRFASAREWGILLLHLGLILLTVAGAMNYLFLQRGYLQLMTGERFRGRANEFAALETGLLAPPLRTDIQIRLDKVEAAYWDTGQLRRLRSQLTLFLPNGTQPKTATVAINAPLSIAGLRVHQSFNHGYVLTLTLQDPYGVRTRTFFLLDAPAKAGQPARAISSFPASPYRFDLRFFPDIAGKSLSPRRPLLSVKVFRGRTVVFNGLLLPGQQAPLDANGKIQLRFEEFSLWSGLIVQRQRDRWPAYLGFALCVAAGLLLYGPRLRPRRNPPSCAPS